MVIHDLDDLGYPYLRKPPYIYHKPWIVILAINQVRVTCFFFYNPVSYTHIYKVWTPSYKLVYELL